MFNIFRRIIVNFKIFEKSNSCHQDCRSEAHGMNAAKQNGPTSNDSTAGLYHRQSIIHISFVLVLLIAAVVLFTNLSGQRLWADEADTAVLARNIIEYGIPRAWDGRTFIDSDRGERTNSHLVMVSTPWVPFYVTAMSFALFGESELTARFPFALAGLATVALLYVLVLRVTGNRSAAFVAAFLLTMNPQFLLYARECRHYVLNMLLTLAMLTAFLRLAQRPREVFFVFSTVLLYHVTPLAACANLAALGALTLVHPGFASQRRAFWLRLPIVLSLTLPSLLLSWGVVKEVVTFLPGIAEAAARLSQISIEATVAIPVLSWVVLMLAVRGLLHTGDRRWLALAGFPCVVYIMVVPIVLSTTDIWVLGLRYVCALLPLAAGMSGVLVARASRGRTVPAVALVALLTFTHLGWNSLFWAFTKGNAFPTQTSASFHTPPRLFHKIVRTDLAGYVRGLFEPNPGSVSEIVEYLRFHAKPDDILITNYAWEPIYYYTDLRQGLKIMKEYSIYTVARRAGLPEYVFSVDGADWVVWRSIWENYQGYSLVSVRNQLLDRGYVLDMVHNFEDTIWENRPELNFHRFPGYGVIYSDPTRLQPYFGMIFRVRPVSPP